MLYSPGLQQYVCLYQNREMDIENYILNLIKNNFYLWNLDINTITPMPYQESAIMAVDSIQSHLIIEYFCLRNNFSLVLYDATFDEVKQEEMINPENLSDALTLLLFDTDNPNSVLCKTICLN